MIDYILGADFDIDVFEAVSSSLQALFEASTLTPAQQDSLIRSLTAKLTERLRLLVVVSFILGEQVTQVQTGESYEISDELRAFILRGNHEEINALFEGWYTEKFGQAPLRPLLKGPLTPNKKGIVLSAGLAAQEGEPGWDKTQDALKALTEDGDVGLAFQVGTKQGRLARVLMKLFGSISVSMIGVKDNVLRSSRLRFTLRQEDISYLLDRGVRVERPRDKDGRIIETNRQLTDDYGLDIVTGIAMVLINADAEYLVYQFPEGENRNSISIQERKYVNMVLAFMDQLLSSRDLSLAAQRAA